MNSKTALSNALIIIKLMKLHKLEKKDTVKQKYNVAVQMKRKLLENNC